jgi:hypothetical protein
MESVNNKSFTPLEAGRAYIGLSDRVESYSSCVVSLISDQPCVITMYQSQNKTLEYVETYAYTDVGNQYIQDILLSAPFVYFTVRNQGVQSQTYLQFTVIYKTAYPPSTFGESVNISDSNGANLLSDGSGNLGMKLNAINSTLQFNNGLRTYIVNADLPVSITSQRISGKVWNSAVVEDEGVSSKFDCSAVNTTNVSVYGTTSVAGKITVLFSGDNSIFYASQYSIDAEIGDFGFSAPVSAPSLRLLWNGAETTITSYLSIS